MAAPGQTPMTAAQQGSLADSLKAVSPPENKKIPFQRTDPEHVWLIRLQGVRHALHECDEQLDDKDDVTGAIVSAFGQGISRLMQGVPPQEIALLVAAALLKPVSPQLAAMAESQWASVNSAPSVSGAPVPQGPPVGGPGTLSPAQNPGVLAAMGGAPGMMGGSQPPGVG